MVRLWIIYIIIMMVCLFYSFGGHEKHNKCIRIVSIIMVLFSGLRSWWFGDLIKYYTRFVSESQHSLKEIFLETGWRNIGLSLIYKIAFLIFGKYGYDVLIFLIAWFSAYTLAKVITSYSSSAYWSYLMYLSMGFYIFTFSGLKQTTAMGFCCLAMCALMRDDLKKFLIYVGMGALFHMPALAFIVAYPFSRKKFGIGYVGFVVGIWGGMYYFRNQLVFLLEDAYYSEEAASSSLGNAVSGVGGRFIAMILIMILAAIRRPLVKKDVDYNKVFNVMVIAAAIQMLSVFDNTYTRLADYFYQFVVLFVPMFMVPSAPEEKLLYSGAGNIHQQSLGNFIISFGVTAFSVWFYSTQISGIELYGKILFFWEKNGHLLYGG